MSFRFKRRGLHATLTACAVAVGMLATSHAAYAWVPCPVAEIPSASITEWTTQYGERRETAKGVTLCEGDGGLFGADTRGFLQIVDLGDGAKIRLQAQDDISRPHGTRDPITPYRKRTSQAWYEWIRGLRSTPENLSYLTPGKEKLFSVTNAAFFKTTENEVEETALPFPFMFNYAHDTYGMALKEAYPAYPRSEWIREAPRANFDYDAPKEVLQLNSEMRPEHEQRVRIRGFRERYEVREVNEWYRFHPEDPFSIQDAAVSFTGEFDNSGRGQERRRTYVGVLGQVVYIWTSEDWYTNAQANATMLEINPGMDVIQMDGGGSTQFYAGEYGHMLSEADIWGAQRDVPSVLSVYKGP